MRFATSAGYGSEEHLIDVTPAPILARLERLNDRVFGSVKMLGGVLVFGGITATDVATLQTKPEMDPSVVHLKAFFTAFATGSDLLDFFCVGTSLSHGSPQDFRFGSSTSRTAASVAKIWNQFG
jgi:hypothetical protein